MLEPLLDVHEVGIEGALVTRVDHPYDETELEEAVYVATTARENTKSGKEQVHLRCHIDGDK